MRCSVLVTGVCLTLTVACVAAGKIIYVDDDANAPGDGRAWQTAYRYLQDALADAKTADMPVEIRVAQGVYKPDQGAGQMPGERMASFELISGVALKGGYGGIGMPDPNVRNTKLHVTILSGDLAGDDVLSKPLNFVFDPHYQGLWGLEYWNILVESTRLENSTHVIIAGGTGQPIVVDGFTIRGGNAYHPPYRFRDLPAFNKDDQGGAVLNESASLTLSSCMFVANSAMGGGSAVYSKGPCQLEMTHCHFLDNFNWGGGGAVNNSSSVSVVMKGCVFERNDGGGVFCDRGSRVVIKNSALWNNQSPSGPEIALEGDSIPSSRISYSLIRGGKAGVALDSTGGLVWGVGNIDQEPCFASPGYRDANGTPDDSSDDFLVLGDYHLRSQAGRWDVESQHWVIDDVTSPCIDAGDPASAIGFESFPNGGRVNIGPYGGTAEASKSYFGGAPCQTIIAGDINGDCRVDFRDLAIMAMNWLEDRTAHRIVTTTYRLIEDKSSVVSYCGRGGTKRYAISGTFDLTIDYTGATATFERVDVTSDKTMSFIDNLVGRAEVFVDTNDLNVMFHMTQLVSTYLKDTEVRFLFSKNIPGFPFADVRVTMALKEDSASITGKFSDPMSDGCWHDLNAFAVPVREP